MSQELSDPRDDPGSALDLAAAEVRLDNTDIDALIEGLAARLEEALPRMAAVRRRRVGGFRSKHTEVEQIQVELGDERFELVQARGGLQCTRHRVVRGITLKRDELPVAQWIVELIDQVGRTAAVGEQARIALGKLADMSPLFGRSRGPKPDPAQLEVQAQRDQESLERLAQGRIPLNAAERLTTLAGHDPKSLAFASDLSVQEYALLHSLGIVPVTLVMGSSIYQVGWQGSYFMVPTEIQSLSDAYNESRRLALNRLLEETTLVGADAVVGVRIEQGSHEFAAGSVEFVAVGTAVRLPPALRGSDGPVLSDLDGQQFWQLCAAGIRPVGIAAHTSVHYVPATWQTARAQGGGMFGGSWNNQELVDFTQGVYDAREKAMTYVTQQASVLGADGIIGVKIDEHARGRRVSRGGIECDDLIVTFHVIGTAIREDPSLASDTQAVPTTILSLA